MKNPSTAPFKDKMSSKDQSNTTNAAMKKIDTKMYITSKALMVLLDSSKLNVSKNLFLYQSIITCK